MSQGQIVSQGTVDQALLASEHPVVSRMVKGWEAQKARSVPVACPTITQCDGHLNPTVSKLTRRPGR